MGHGNRAPSAVGGLERLILINNVTGNQVTRWIFGTELDSNGNGIARSDLLRAKIYPESDDEAEPLGDGFDNTYERIEYSHNRQGQVVEMKDPNETVHQYLFDKLGRELQDIVTEFGNEDLDQTVKRIETTYDTKRLLTVLVTSYDNATVGMGVVVNQVEMVHDDFGQLIEDIQEHSGAVDVNTPSVKYAHEDGSRANTARRTSMTYPDGRILNYTYGTDGEANDRLSRVGALQIEGEGFDACTYTFVGAARYVKIAYPQPSVELSYFKPTTAPNGDAGDKYNGYDRFGRTVDMRWIKSPGASVRDRIQYGYDRANNRTWRKNLAATNKGKDNAYQYDGLYQVKQNAVGTLNTNQTAIGAIPGEQENFSYDPSGNWTNYQRAENGTEVLDQSRVNNQDNQVTQIDGSSDAIAYDKAGNATKLPPGVDGDWSKHFQLKWDGWNRLVEIRDQDSTLVATYAYDGMFRRTTKAVGSETRSYYYNDQWKCVEERSTGSPSSSSSSSSANANSSSSSSNPNSPSSSGTSLIVTSGEAEIQYVWGARPNHRDELILRDRDTSGNGVLDERLYCLMDYYDPTSIVDTNGDVVERYKFSAFGVRTVYSPTWVEQNESSFDFDFGFHGQFLDEESGYYDYGYRYYSPELGRWLNRDPIGESGGVNVFGFVGNKPNSNADRFGLGGSAFIPDSAEPYKFDHNGNTQDGFVYFDLKKGGAFIPKWLITQDAQFKRFGGTRFSEKCNVNIVIELYLQRSTGVELSQLIDAIEFAERTWSDSYKLCCTCSECPNGYRINLNIIAARAGREGIPTIPVVADASRSNQISWNLNQQGVVAHEIGHFLGNPDEYGNVSNSRWAIDSNKRPFMPRWAKDNIRYHDSLVNSDPSGKGRPYGDFNAPVSWGPVMNNPLGPPLAGNFWLVNQRFEELINSENEGTSKKCSVRNIHDKCS